MNIVCDLSFLKHTQCSLNLLVVIYHLPTINNKTESKLSIELPAKQKISWNLENNIFGITQLYLYLEIDASPVWVWFGKLGASILTPWLDQIWCPGQHIQSCGPLPQVFWGWLLKHKHMITQVCAHRCTLADSLKKASHKLVVLRTIGKKNTPHPQIKGLQKGGSRSLPNRTLHWSLSQDLHASEWWI